MAVVGPTAPALGFDAEAGAWGGIPICGGEKPEVKRVDDAMLKHLRQSSASAASVVVAYNGEPVVARDYGWSDAGRAILVTSHILFGIGDCDRLLVDASILQMADHYKHLSLDVPLFSLLKIEPQRLVIDELMATITVRHVLDRQTGWQGEPLEQARRDAHALGHRDPIPVDVLLAFVMSQKLKHRPGTVHEDCTFCTEVLRQLITSVTGASPAKHYRRSITGEALPAVLGTPVDDTRTLGFPCFGRRGLGARIAARVERQTRWADRRVRTNFMHRHAPLSLGWEAARANHGRVVVERQHKFDRGHAMAARWLRMGRSVQRQRFRRDRKRSRRRGIGHRTDAGK